MGKFSSKEIENQYDLIKMLLSEPKKYKDANDAIKKDIAYMPLEVKKKLEKENILYKLYFGILKNNYRTNFKRLRRNVRDKIQFKNSY